LLLLPITLIARRIKGEFAALTFVPVSPLLILAVGLTVAGYSMQAITAFILGAYTQRRDTHLKQVGMSLVS